MNRLRFGLILLAALALTTCGEQTSASDGRFVTEATWTPDGVNGTGYVVCDTKTGNLLYYVVAGTAVGVTVVSGGCAK